MSDSGPASLIGHFLRQDPGAGSLTPMPFTTARERSRQIAAPWSDGRCLIAGRYEDDREIERLQQHRKIPDSLLRRPESQPGGVRVVGGRLEARSLSAPALDTGRLFGPRLRVAGTLVVDRCRGC